MRTESLIFKLLLGFNIATWILYLVSPISINSGHHYLNVLYVAINIFMIYKGFKAGVIKSNRIKSINAITPNNTKIFPYLLVFYICTFLFRYSYTLYIPPFDIASLANRIAIGIADPYIGRRIDHGARTLPWTIYFLTSIVDSIFFIVALLKWKSHGNFVKSIVVLLMIVEFFYWMGTGTNFGVFMLASSIVLIILANSDNISINKKGFMKYIIVGLVALLAMISVFSYNMEGRSGGDFNSLRGDSFLALDAANIDVNSPILQWLPYRRQILVLFIFSYLTQGYVFLENIFNLNFHWGGFFGNNPTLQSIARDFLGFNPEVNSYQMQMERLGVDSYVNWHSCYLWLANDFTIIGVPFVVYMISKLTSTALYMYRKNNDIVSGVVFVIFANMILFLFANNNYISSVFYSFIFIFPFWYFKRYRKI